jgi:hypothetical protein
MSISRSHGQFEVEMDPATGVNAIFLKDSGSRYGTAVDGVKMAANGKIPLNGPVHQIKFGANQGTIILRVADFRFCFSQLDRAEKEELKVSVLACEILSMIRRLSHQMSSCPVVVFEVEGSIGNGSRRRDTFGHEDLDSHHQKSDSDRHGYSDYFDGVGARDSLVDSTVLPLPRRTQVPVKSISMQIPSL